MAPSADHETSIAAAAAASVRDFEASGRDLGRWRAERLLVEDWDFANA